MASQGTDAFKNTIDLYLQRIALEDPLFAETLKKENKNLDDCITYIFNTVQKSGCNGFTDEEVFQMAVHYYDEDNIEIGKKVNAQVVVNHHVELTQDEITKAKEKAIETVISEAKQKMATKTVKKKEQPISDTPSLFD